MVRAWRRRRLYNANNGADNAVLPLTVIATDDGDYAFTTDRSATAAGYVTGDADSGFSIDTTAESGLDVLLVRGRPTIRV